MLSRPKLKTDELTDVNYSEFCNDLETLTQMYGQPKILPVRNGIPLS